MSMNGREMKNRASWVIVIKGGQDHGALLEKGSQEYEKKLD